MHLVGEGEIYVPRVGVPFLLEVFSVGSAKIQGHDVVMTNDHYRGWPRAGGGRLFIGIDAFLRHYRPATLADCRQVEGA